MKRGIVKILLLTFLIGVFYTASAFADPFAYLSLVDSSSPITVGDPFEIEVWVDGDDTTLDFLAFGFDVGIETGGVFTYTGATTESGFDMDSFVMDFSGSAFPGLDDDVLLLATLSFTALSEGTDTLDVIGLYDGEFSGLYYETPDWDLTGYDINASITIEVAAGSQPQPVPEPATLLLFGAGLVAIGAAKKHKKV